jgi:manganese efflux pump family protein
MESCIHLEVKEGGKMNILSIVLIAIGLSVDSFTIALTYGMVTKKLRARNILKISIFLGALQTIAPLIGWSVGVKLKDYLSSMNHWVAIALLSTIGIRMIFEAIRGKKERDNYTSLNFKTLPLITFAVSFDEIIAGLSFAFLKISIFQAITVIGIITFIMSLVGICIGKRFGKILKDKSELIGGIIFIIIGLKSFIS